MQQRQGRTQARRPSVRYSGGYFLVKAAHGWGPLEPMTQSVMSLASIAGSASNLRPLAAPGLFEISCWEQHQAQHALSRAGGGFSMFKTIWVGMEGCGR